MKRVIALVLSFTAIQSPPSHADLLTPPSPTLILAPLQMPDGTKRWRASTRPLKHEHAEAGLQDLIAQAMARAAWCPNGWEETQRSEPLKGFLLIEGRCR